jgi:hypothetical protein
MIRFKSWFWFFGMLIGAILAYYIKSNLIDFIYLKNRLTKKEKIKAGGLGIFLFLIFVIFLFFSIFLIIEGNLWWIFTVLAMIGIFISLVVLIKKIKKK